MFLWLCLCLHTVSNKACSNQIRENMVRQPRRRRESNAVWTCTPRNRKETQARVMRGYKRKGYVTDCAWNNMWLFITESRVIVVAHPGQFVTQLWHFHFIHTTKNMLPTLLPTKHKHAPDHSKELFTEQTDSIIQRLMMFEAIQSSVCSTSFY